MRTSWMIGLWTLCFCAGEALAASLNFGELDTGAQTVEIVLDNRVPLGGFQIAVQGVSLVEDLGGRAEDAEMVIHVGPGMVLGFVLFGDPLPAGNGVLVKLAYSGDPADEICMLDEGTVLSDPVGEEVAVTIGPCIPSGDCDLSVELTNLPRVVERGETARFTAMAVNGCSDERSFDEAVMEVTGPVSLSRPLYAGAPVVVTPGGEISAPVAVAVPPQAPTGIYEVTVSISEDGDRIAQDAFEVRVE